MESLAQARYNLLLVLLVLAPKVLAGGVFVVAFALISDVLKPKMFAGLFSAAPSVALAGLLVTALAVKPSEAATTAMGMIVGSAAMVACCLLAAPLVRRLGAVAGSALAWGAWLVVALGLSALVFG